MIIEVEKIYSDQSRYGPVSFELAKNSFMLVQGEDRERFTSERPTVDAFGLFEREFQHRKPRVYCNRTVRKVVSPLFNFFGLISDDKIVFHRSPKYLITTGTVIGSYKSMELSFNMPHDFMKKQQIRRLHLGQVDFDDSRYGHVLFKVLETELVTWKTRNMRFDHPVITIG
ncbi:hypothetical protein EVB81_241 [Rhizobium phage RHph_I46]|uniref:Uncharacterized protein n=1 Tax=Rhizobium phage RHph_I1_9 TaxID=2509729 RepID=A0A7S5R9N5_9CAUD|nr:hypothetical protein PP936_gp239 [Rhizobium phage RHph_I1_9]QIG69810.1 hypothetical protein EVB81_241 [Rhizobium phage RHph_I46]QIG71091.1 hypothetical protein EVB92_241 [Rhizobium phage RHph_I9]QIG73676.1 hypothetical protein EVC04_239 [Rhizobium phage RHph_I1_9]QIG76430.1 hypothetical protein EVC25_241 [Rhizobium phage RHph_I34]